MAPAPPGPGPSRRQPSTRRPRRRAWNTTTPTTTRQARRGRGGPAAMTAGRRSTRTSHGAGAAEFIRARTRRDLPRTHGPMAPRGGGPDRQRRAIPGGADQAVRHLAGVLGARRRSGHPHRKTQAPGHRGPYTPNVIESLHAGACEAAHAGGADPGGHASPQEPRQNRPPPAAAHTQPASWHDRNRAEPDPMRAASRPEDMTATAPESAGRQIFSSYLIWPLTTSV